MGCKIAKNARLFNLKAVDQPGQKIGHEYQVLRVILHQAGSLSGKVLTFTTRGGT